MSGLRKYPTIFLKGTLLKDPSAQAGFVHYDKMALFLLQFLQRVRKGRQRSHDSIPRHR
jgi:hypothetical protein